MYEKLVSYSLLALCGLFRGPNEQLRTACKWGDAKAVRALLEHKEHSFSNVRALINKDGENPVHLAAISGSLDCIVMLIDKEPTLTTIEDKSLYWPPLFYAAHNGHSALVRFLLDQDKNQLEHEDIWCRTVLHTAADGGHLDVVSFLVERGANILARDRQGYTPLHVAAEKGNYSIVAYLINRRRCACRVQNSFGRTPLHEATKSGAQRVVALLCASRECDLNAHDQAGWAPLHWAVRGGSVQSVQLLVQFGADVDICDSSGRTPLHRAVEADQYPVACELIQQGASMDVQDRFGRTPLMSLLEQPAPIRKLLRSTFCRSRLPSLPLLTLLVLVSDLSVRDKEGLTVRTYFAKSDYEILYDSLRRKRADYEAQVHALTQRACKEIPRELGLLISQFVFGQ